MSEELLKPDGRPSDLYRVKGHACKAEILVDRQTRQVYAAPYNVRSMLGWSVTQLTEWINAHSGWSLEHVGEGSSMKELKSE